MVASASAIVDWHEQISCLLTKCLIAPLKSIDDLDATSDAHVSKSKCAIFAHSLSLDQLTHLLDTQKISAIIIRDGSLADHPAGLANARGIQLAIAPHLAEPPQGSFVIIDGIHERLALTADKLMLDGIYESLQIETGTKSILKKNRVDAGANCTDLHDGASVRSAVRIRADRRTTVIRRPVRRRPDPRRGPG